ncbi:MAG TPA: efflux transporter outer membrane subunit, partial [Planctomycetota bacterium]|nr:efflux transporter outer membrane subunit [Planctomycetota bacterium]
MQYQRLMLISATLLLVACGAKDTPRDADLTAGALPGAVPTKGFVSEAEAGAVADGWLKTFNDPQLEKLVAEAIVGNRDLAVMNARLDQAASRARQAGADLKPQVSLAAGANAGGSGNAPHTEQMGAGLTMTWEIDVWGRMSAGVRAAQEAYASTAADTAFARESLAAQVVKGWFLAIQAVQQEDIVSRGAELRKRNMEIATERNRVGKASATDVALARADYAEAQDAVEKAKSGRENAARSLEVLLGRYPSAELTIAAKLPVLPPPPPAGLPSQLMERRPDLVAATRRVASAFNQVESAKAARYPRFAITADAGALSQDFKSMSLNDAFWNLGANMLGPIFDGGRLKEQVIIETAKQDEALALYGKAALETFRQVEQALTESRRLITRVDLLASAEKNQNKAERLTKKRFDAGTIDQLTLILVQERALLARLASLAIQVEALTNRVNFHLSLGGGFELPPSTPEDQSPPSKA